MLIKSSIEYDTETEIYKVEVWVNGEILLRIYCHTVDAIDRVRTQVETVLNQLVEQGAIDISLLDINFDDIS